MPEKQRTPPEGSGLTIIPAVEVKPEEVGPLSLRYVDGVPQLVISGGTVPPTGWQWVDGDGNVLAAYIATRCSHRRAGWTSPRTSPRLQAPAWPGQAARKGAADHKHPAKRCRD
ncbi:hypothetical protein [Streptomyces sp. NPDC060031]|uniref:hypothetical protein n=1 Tax=Streptomyces sp. NPDC060031 TaxID=3347043 RepID=UPI0036CECAA0